MNLKLCLIIFGLLCSFALSDARNYNKKSSQKPIKTEKTDDENDNDVDDDESYRFLTGGSTSSAAALNNFLDRKSAMLEQLRPTSSIISPTSTGIVTNTGGVTSTGITTGASTATNTNLRPNLGALIVPQIINAAVQGTNRRPNGQRRRRRRRPNNNGPGVYVLRVPQSSG